jgi:hypothetical protein
MSHSSSSFTNFSLDFPFILSLSLSLWGGR